MSEVCVVYHDDIDGKMSAAITYSYLNLIMEENEISFVPFNYGQKSISKKVINSNYLYMLDCSFTYDQMSILKKLYGENFIWIDHHKTSMIENKDLNLKGSRDIEFGCCNVTWNYFFNKIYLPKGVDYIARYDIWNFGYKEEEIKNFVEVFNYPNLIPTDKLFENLIYNKLNYKKINNQGKMLRMYRIAHLRKEVENFAEIYELEFEGESIKCMNMNCSSLPSINEAHQLMWEIYKVPVTLTWYMDKNESVHYSIRSYDETDVSKIAKFYGGGGHKHAAGFQLN